MHSCTGDCMQMRLPVLAVANVLRIIFLSPFHTLFPPLLPLSSSGLPTSLPPPLQSSFTFFPHYSPLSLFLSVPSLPVPSFPSCQVSLPLIGEAFPTQALVQLSSLLPSFLPLLLLLLGLCRSMSEQKEHSGEGHYGGAWVCTTGPSCQCSSHRQMCKPWKRSPFIPSERTDVKRSRSGK